MLTDAERKAVRLAGELYTLIRDEVCGDGPARDADLAELAADIHRIQHRVTAQAAARMYPGEFRLMGEVVSGQAPASAAASEPAAEPCPGFQWIGQSFATCDRCGKPAWEHEGEMRAAVMEGAADGRRNARLTGMPRPPRFFFSHSMQDVPEVDNLRTAIAALGVEVYLAEHDPRPGAVLADKVTAAITASDAVLVLLTESAASSPWVQQEIGAARSAGKLIVPIVAAGVPAGEGVLAGIEWISVDFASPADAVATVSAALEPLVRKHFEQQRAQELLLALGLVAAILLIAYSQ
jgi:TIR domain